MKVKRLLLALGLMIASGMMVLNAKNVAHEGTFKGGTWTVYDDGELRIARSSKGAIPDYQDSQAPWAAYAEEIKWIYLDESKGKITRIGKWAFRDLEVDSIKQGNRPANHLQLETLGKKAFNGFNAPSLYISGNKEMSRHTAINSTPILGFKNMETVWEYGLAGDHYMIDLGPDIKMLKAGSLASETLLYLTDELIPYLRKQYGTLPIVLGGYSLGGLFSLWAASQTDVLTAVAAMSPSLWIANWAEYSAAHPVRTQYVYLSLGDREEFTRNRAVAQVGNNVRVEYARLTEQLGTGRCTLEWNPGNHFANGPIRTAKGFAWCLSKLKNNPVSNEI